MSQNNGTAEASSPARLTPDVVPWLPPPRAVAATAGAGVVKSFGGGFDLSRALPWRRNEARAGAARRRRREDRDPPRRDLRRHRRQRLRQVDADPHHQHAAAAGCGRGAHLRARRRAGHDDGAAADQPRVGRPVVLPQHDGAGEPDVLRPRLRADAAAGEGRRRRRSCGDWASSGSARWSR